MIKLQFVIFLLALSQIAVGQPEIKGTPQELKGFLYPNKNTVVIKAFAKEEAFADKALVNLVIKSREKLISKAMELNSKIREDARKELIKFGVKPANINNSKFSQSPHYGWFGKKPDYYEVITRLSIEIAEENQLKKAAEIADGNESITIGDITFKHSSKDEYTKKVKEKALEKVKDQQRQYEKSLGVKLKPFGIKSFDSHSGATAGAAVVEEVVVTGFRSSGSSKSKSYATRSRKAPTFEEIKYTANISVEYEVISN